jgi:2-oxoglutarate ferredoxin oxidoreductase subunit gamma
MKKQINKILLAGEGGQGVQTMAKVLAQLFVDLDFNVSYIPQFGPEQRGTPSVSFIQYSKNKIACPRYEKADLIVVLRRRALSQIERFIDKDTEIIFDSSTIPRKLIQQNNSFVFGIPATKIAEEKFSHSVLNVIVLGVMSKTYLDIPKEVLWNIIEKQLSKKFAKKPELKKQNQAALDLSYEIELENVKYSRPAYDTHNEIIVVKGEDKTAVLIPKYCKGCGICILKCPVSALKFGKVLGVYGTPTPDIDIKKCIRCGNCFRYCPDSAIKVEKNI